MDCDTARLFLQFCRPGHTDLDGPEEVELEEHLAHCSACHALAVAQKRLDDHLGRAMRAVDPPPGLSGRIQERLTAQRKERHLRWLKKVSRVASIAAGILVGIGVAWYAIYAHNVPRISAAEVLFSFNAGKPDEERANQLLKQLGASAAVSDRFNFSFLFAMPAVTVLPGYEQENIKVPQLVFAHDAGKARHLAIVFIIDERRYPVDDLENSSHGYKCRLAVYRPGGRYAYLVFHNGKTDDDWEKWLLRPDAGDP